MMEDEDSENVQRVDDTLLEAGGGGEVQGAEGECGGRDSHTTTTASSARRTTLATGSYDDEGNLLNETTNNDDDDKKRNDDKQDVEEGGGGGGVGRSNRKSLLASCWCSSRQNAVGSPDDYNEHLGQGRQYWRDILLGVNDGT